MTRPLQLGLLLIFAAGAAIASSRLEGTLPRRAELGFALREEGEGLAVASVTSGSAAASSGLREGDRIVGVAGRDTTTAGIARDLLRRLDGGVRAAISVEREGRRIELAFTPSAKPLEAIEGLELLYGDLTTPDGARLRTILSRPDGATRKLPAIFLVQWVSCGAIEPIDPGPWGDVERSIARRSGAVFARVERSSGGDSEGPGCHELDFDTELAQYRFAFARLAEHPWIDSQRIVIFGMSLGSATAPLLADAIPHFGVVVSGGGALTFFERMLAFDRIEIERGGTPPAEIDAKMRRHAEFLVEYLLRGRDPAAIATERPELASVWGEMRGTERTTHYGRPYAWHRQLAAKDLSAAWGRITAPVFVVYGQYDQFEPPHALRAAADLLERLRPGQARALEIAGMNHFFDVYPNALDAFAERNGHPAAQLAAQPILAWLADVVGFPAAP